MRAAFRAFTLAQIVWICPALFLACSNQKPAETGQAEATSAAVGHVDAKGAHQLLASKPGVVVLDVRKPEEYAAGHVAGARNIDFNAPDFKERLGKLDRDTTYVVHCAAGGRSTRSLERFQELGFKSVIHMDGGFNGWTQAGLPVEK